MNKFIDSVYPQEHMVQTLADKMKLGRREIWKRYKQSSRLKSHKCLFSLQEVKKENFKVEKDIIRLK